MNFLLIIQYEDSQGWQAYIQGKVFKLVEAKVKLSKGLKASLIETCMIESCFKGSKNEAKFRLRKNYLRAQGKALA